MSRYEPRCSSVGTTSRWRPFDTVDKCFVGEEGSWSAAQVACGRLNFEIETRGKRMATAAPPCACGCACACAERLERMERALAHFWAGMEMVWPTMGFPDQQTVALRAIAEARRIMREAKVSSGDAFVKVWCDNKDCREEVEVQLPFVYSGVMHTVGHYDHRDETINKLVAKEEWIVADGKHYCSEECRDNA